MPDTYRVGKDRTRRLLVTVATTLALVMAGIASTSVAADAAVADDAAAACAELATHDFGPEVLSVTATFNDSGVAEGRAGLPAFCDVRIVVSEMINIATWLPAPEAYNNRLQAVGGGRYAGSISFGAMAAALRDGYATASTDTGHQGGGDFVFDESGGLDWQLIEDFASRSLFEMTAKTRTLIEAFYGASQEYAY